MAAAFSDILPDPASVEKLGDGFTFTEGPVWDPAGGYLLFSDIPENTIHAWDREGGIRVFRQPSGKSNGMTRDAEGRLIVCEHYNRRVSRTEHDGSVTPIATHYQGRKLNSPNDVVVKSDGDIYFTDPPYGLGAVFGIAAPPELPFAGVYRARPSTGEVELLISDMTPNGLAFSVDESVLYVADTEANHVKSFALSPDGAVEDQGVFVDIPGHPLAPDGMKLDQDGRVYVTGLGGVWVFSPEGERLGVIPTAELPANIGWGEADWRTLFITARGSVYRARLEVSGIPLVGHA